MGSLKRPCCWGVVPQENTAALRDELGRSGMVEEGFLQFRAFFRNALICPLFNGKEGVQGSIP